MNMKFTRILKMLLVLALSTSITSCDEFFAIFDDPVESTDPVTPPEPEPETPTTPETTLPSDEELKANALNILAEIQKEGALFSIYFTLDGVESVATFKTENGQFVYQEPAANVRRSPWVKLGNPEIAKMLSEINRLILTMQNISGGAIAQVSINAGNATYSQVTPVVDGSQASLEMQGIALMKAGTTSEDIPKTMLDAANNYKEPAAVVDELILTGDFMNVLQPIDPTLLGRIGGLEEVPSNGELQATSLTIDAADDEGKIYMKVGETKNLGIKIFPTNNTVNGLTYNIDNEGVVTVDNGILTALSAGQAEVTVSLAGINESVKKVTVIVGKTSASISYPVPEYDKYWSPTPDDNTVTYLVTNTGDGVVTYAVQDGSNTCGAIVDPETGKVTFTKAGKATIIATTSSTNTYTYEGDDATASYTLTIHKIDGSISFATSEVNKTNTDAAFTNTLTNTGDGTVTYSSDKTSVAKVDASTGEVTIMGVGNAIITATVEDGTNYTYPTKSVTYKLNISANPSILDKPTGYGHGENPF